MDAEPARTIILGSGGYRAAVSPVGASLAALSFDGRPLVSAAVSGDDGAAVPLPLFSGTVLAPWPNRIRDGRYEFGGTTHQLPVSEPGRGCALHGLLAWTRWDVVERSEAGVHLGSRIHPQPGYPFTVDVEVTYELDADGLHVGIAATNRCSATAPFGASIHPYLVPGVTGGLVDDWTLRIPMATVIDVDPARLLPRGTLDVDATRFDFRTPTALAGAVLDHAFGGCGFDADGTASAVLTGPDGFGSVISWDARCPWLQLCTGDEAVDGFRRTGLAVEPMSCPPDAFNSGTDLWHLAPGERRDLALTISAAPAGNATPASTA